MMKRLVIDITERDCMELIDGRSFEWEWPVEGSQEKVKVYLYNPDVHGPEPEGADNDEE